MHFLQKERFQSGYYNSRKKHRNIIFILYKNTKSCMINLIGKTEGEKSCQLDFI